MQDIILTIMTSTFAFLILAGLTATCVHFISKERIYRYSGQGWLNIEDHPIPDNVGEYIATDGKHVRVNYGIKWGPHGKIIFSEYDKTYVTHWQPLPDIPSRK